MTARLKRGSPISGVAIISLPVRLVGIDFSIIFLRRSADYVAYSLVKMSHPYHI